MAPRLSVVVSYGGGAHGLSSDQAADLVARLMGEPGCDVSLIGPLDQLGDHETDRLMLEGLRESYVFISANPSAQVTAALLAYGILNQTTESAGQLPIRRRVIAIEVDSTSPTESVVHTVQSILRDMRTPVVTLGGMNGKGRMTAAKSISLSKLPVASENIKRNPENRQIPVETASAQWLDSLVDDLDDLDL